LYNAVHGIGEANYEMVVLLLSAGADIHLADAVKYMANEVGISQDDAIRMASLIPARVLGMEHEIGCLAPNTQADFLWMRKNLDVEKVWKAGQEIT